MAHAWTRRQALGLLAAPLLADNRKTVAAVVTEYRWYSHADVILGRILGGYSANGVHTPPRSRLVALYTDQVPQNDMSREMAARHGFRIYPTISETLRNGGPRLAVDAVIFIGEHGDYPVNELGQKMYPRYELFSQILDIYEKDRRAVPTFFDKHLSYDWAKASEIWQRSRRLGFPMMAGSSIPVTVRTPRVELALGTPLEAAVVVGYADLDAYGFHTLEVLQCMVERRAGGETGIDSVEMVLGEDVWRWHDSEAGAWSRPLLAAALSRHPGGLPLHRAREGGKSAVFVLQYRDGLRAAAYMLNPHARHWLFAAQLKGQAQPVSTLFGPAERTRPLPHFDGLVRCIEEMFVTGKEPWPVERTVLTTGALAFLFQSKRTGGPVRTPELNITYKAPKDAWFQNA
jgi:hypothetical protein